MRKTERKWIKFRFLLYNGSMKKSIISIVCVVVPVLALVAMGFALSGLSQSVGELRTEISRSEADAILASADIENEAVLSAPILYYDQKMDDCVNIYDADLRSVAEARQFEWASCGYLNDSLEKNMTSPVLDEEYLPVAIGGTMMPNRGVRGDNFKRWFSQVDGLSKSYAKVLSLKYNSATASFGYENESFYPLNDVATFDKAVNKDGNNHLFTLNLGVPFQVLADGNEEFTIAADDDTWVYVGDKLVLDMGGIHDALTGRLKITNSGEVYSAVGGEELAFSGVKLAKETSSVIRIFHADRNSTNSVFKIRFTNMLLNFEKNTTVASEGGVEVAYDPANPSYVAPLGESLTVRPDKSRTIVSAIVVQSVILMALAVVVVLAISVAVRYSHRDRSPE